MNMTDTHYSAWTGEGPKHADTDPDQAERDRLRAINAELVEALEYATTWCEHNGCGVGRTAEMPWLEDAITALSKAGKE